MPSHPQLSYPRTRVSSTLRLLGSITGFSGILGHPLVSDRSCAPRRTTARLWPIHPSRLATLAPQDDGDMFVASRTFGYTFAFSRRIAPELCWKLFALGSQRAQGRPGARCTRGLVCNVHKECAHEHTGQRRTSDIPCAMALRLIACSPRRTALLPPSRPEKLLPPGALTPAPRRQDHTSSPYA